MCSKECVYERERERERDKNNRIHDKYCHGKNSTFNEFERLMSTSFFNFRYHVSTCTCVYVAI